MNFAPFSSILQPLDLNLKHHQFWPFFNFGFLNFHYSTIEISTKSHLWVSNVLFSESIITNLFQKKWSPITRFNSLCTSNFVIFRVFSNIDMLKNFICRFKSEYSMVPKIIASKSMDSQLSNALSNAFIALLLAEISKFQSRKLPL